MAYAMSLAAGTVPVPGYQLLKFLGRGGWGEVWQAQRTNGKAVALKFLRCDNPQAAAQEIRALQAIKQLRHPHLIHIEQIACSGDHLVIVMDLADGSLLDLQQIYLSDYGSQIFPDHLCHYLRQAAEALDFLNARQHEVGGQRVAFRHCDVKPSNLLIQNGQLKLADFSLAAMTTTPMASHRKAGTLAYAAPEVFQGRLSDRTDQYALAVTYCELRTGELPFLDSPRTFDKHYVRPFPCLPLLSPGEQTVIAKALAPVPQDRWPSCVELMDRLARSLAPSKVRR